VDDLVDGRDKLRAAHGRLQGGNKQSVITARLASGNGAEAYPPIPLVTSHSRDSAAVRSHKSRGQIELPPVPAPTALGR